MAGKVFRMIAGRVLVALALLLPVSVMARERILAQLFDRRKGRSDIVAHVIQP